MDQDPNEKSAAESSDPGHSAGPDEHTSPPETPLGCKSCGSLAVEEGYPTQLCANCRNTFSRRPVPLSITAVAGAVAVVLVFALISFPKTLSAGIAVERAKRAETNHLYFKAADEYLAASEIYPDSLTNNAHLFLAYYHSQQIESANKVFQKIAGKEATDKDLVDPVNEASRRISEEYIPTDAFETLLEATKDLPKDQLAAKVREYAKANPNDRLAAYVEANSYYDLKQFDKVVSKLETYLSANGNDIKAELLLVAAYRESGQFDKAIALGNSMLEQVTDRATIQAALARVELKRHQDVKGLELAKQAFDSEQDDGYLKATLALAYHYNNQFQERDAVIALLKQQKEPDNGNLALIESVVSGQLTWRSE